MAPLIRRRASRRLAIRVRWIDAEISGVSTDCRRHSALAFGGAVDRKCRIGWSTGPQRSCCVANMMTVLAVARLPQVGSAVTLLTGGPMSSPGHSRRNGGANPTAQKSVASMPRMLQVIVSGAVQSGGLVTVSSLRRIASPAATRSTNVELGRQSGYGRASARGCRSVQWDD